MTTEAASANAIPADVLTRLKAIVGPGGYYDDPKDIAPLCVSWRDNWVGTTPLVLRPASTAEVAEIVRACAEARVPIVPQGGNTGVTGAGQPHPTGTEVLVSTARLKRIRNLDPLNDTITVEAGVILADIQKAAAAADRLFPLSLAAEGSCQIGGNLATNAGGTQVLRYGNARALVLGLEVVLPDGRIWDGLRALRKDNTGYDLKQLFIGSEGTLGIITAAVLRLLPKPTASETALVAVAGPAGAVKLLGAMRKALGEQVTAFELLGRSCIDLVLTKGHGHDDPFGKVHSWYVLMEVTGQGSPGSLADPVTDALAAAMETGLVTDAVIAGSGEKARRLWAMREHLPEAQKHAGTSIKHDVSVPLSAIPEFIARIDAALAKAYPSIRMVTFGHVGDGNLHVNPLGPPGWDDTRFKAETAPINRIVHDIVNELGGSISAEHGLGRLRMLENERYKSGVELDLMRTLKRALDPDNLMNPGKMLRL